MTFYVEICININTIRQTIIKNQHLGVDCVVLQTKQNKTWIPEYSITEKKTAIHKAEKN